MTNLSQLPVNCDDYQFYSLVAVRWGLLGDNRVYLDLDPLTQRYSAVNQPVFLTGD